jgi:hypothetical protein
MSRGKWFRVTAYDHDYYTTTYSIAVEASSRDAAILAGGVAIGQCKADKEGRVIILLEPEVQVERIDLDAYWAEREEVKVET